MSTINDIINLGFSYHQSGKFTEAELAYNEALNLDSENAGVHNLLSVLKLQQNETDDAIMLAERAIQLNPCEYYYETLFQAYIRAGAYNKIIALKDIILSKYSKNFSLFFNLALAYKNFNDVLEKIGLEVIKAQGEEFDPNLHEAVMQTPTNEVDENVIVAELQKGYKLGDKVLRASLVNVATAP